MPGVRSCRVGCDRVADRPLFACRRGMTQTDASNLDDVVLRLAAAAYLGRYTGTSRAHSESDLRLFLAWCAERDLSPLAAQRTQIELYVRWMQEVRRFKPSTVSRRMAVVTGFYRTCVIDAVLEHSPADYVRRPQVPNESPVLGLSHLQFEALLAAARESTNHFDFALVAMLGLLGLRISEASRADSDDLGAEHGHRVLLVHGKGTLVPLPPAFDRAAPAQSAFQADGSALCDPPPPVLGPGSSGTAAAATSPPPAAHLCHHHAI
jgi:integrase/recombinase XerD